MTVPALPQPVPGLRPVPSDYRYVTTDTVTGRILCDSLPILGQSMSRQLNSTGSFQGTLMLDASVSGTQVREWVAAVEPWRSTLWVLQDGFPIWSGMVTGQPHQSILDGTLPVTAATTEEIFNHRQVSDNLDFVNMDIFEIFRQFLIYAMAKTPNGIIGGTGRYANTIGIVDEVAYSGVIGSVQLDAASFQMILQCWQDLTAAYGLEFTLAPAMTDPGSMCIQVQLGLPFAGRPYSETGLTFAFPQAQFIDYAWQSVQSDPANRIIATGSGTSASALSYVSAPAAGTDTAELAAGYPLLEHSSSYSGTVTSAQQINSYAAGLVVASSVTASRTPVFYMGPGAYPRPRDVQLGDQAMVALTSPLHPADPVTGAPGFTGLMRVTGWTLTPPGHNQTEQIAYQMGGIVRDFGTGG